MNSRNAMTTHAAAMDCQRRRNSGRRVSRQRTGLSETERDIDLLGILPVISGGGMSDGEAGKFESGGIVDVSGGGTYFTEAGAVPADSDSRLATRRRLNAASIIRSAANPV